MTAEKIATSLTEKNVCVYFNDAAVERLKALGVAKEAKARLRDAPARLRVGIGVMRVTGGSPRLRLIDPDSPKALRRPLIERRGEDGDDMPWWSAANAGDIGMERTPGIFTQLGRLWKQQGVELIVRDGVSPTEVMLSQPPKVIGVKRATRKTPKVSDAPGAAPLVALAEARAAEAALPPPEPLPEPSAAPSAPEQAPAAGALPRQRVVVVGNAFDVPLDDLLRVAIQWAHAGYAAANVAPDANWDLVK